MSFTQRDLTLRIAGNTEQELQLSDSTFIYLKSSGSKEVTVIVDGAPIIMAEGDLRKFTAGVSKCTVNNKNNDPVSLVFVVGQGEFIRTRIFTGVEGAIGVRSTLLTSDGSILDNTITERALQISIDSELGIDENGSDSILTSAHWPQNNVVGSPFLDKLYEVHTWDAHRVFDKKFRPLDNGLDDTFSTTIGSAVGVFEGSFIHPFTGELITCTRNPAGTGFLMHRRDLKRRVNEEVAGITADSGEDFIGGAASCPSVDWYTGNMFAKFSNEGMREFKWVTTPSLAGLRYSLEAVTDRTFSGASGASTTIHRLGDGRFLVGYQSLATALYDTDENDNAYLGNYTAQANVSGSQVGFGGVSQQFLIDERFNRTWVGKTTTSQVGALFDLQSDVSLNIHDANNLSANFEHWKTAMPVSGVNVIRDGGYRFLAGSVIAACVKLVRGSNLIPADYMDYIYAIEFHNGTGRVKVDGGRSSFLALEKADGYRVNVDEPIVIHARAGLLDNPVSLYINDNLEL